MCQTSRERAPVNIITLDGDGLGMGINIAVCETEAERAPCREYKLKVVSAKVEGKEFEQYMDTNEIVSLADAEKAVGDMEAFRKRNRLSDDITAVYLEKVKKDDDVAKLKPYAKKVPTGWVIFDRMPGDMKKKALEKGNKDDRVTAWDNVGFDEMKEMCANCPLSWDKGRGCIGAFGPDNSKLPEIAERHGCPIIGAVPEEAKEMKRLSPEEAKKVLAEVEKLRPALVEEGKMAVHRYSGPLDRIEAAAKVAVNENCGMYFF